MKTLLEKIGFSPTRITMKGSEEIGRWYLPVVKSYVKDLIKATEKAGLKQQAGTFTLYDPPATVRVVYHYGAIEVLIDATPPEKKKPLSPRPEEQQDLLVLCGDEDVGYNVAIFAEGGGNLYYRFATIADVMGAFPVARHEQAFRYRYSYVSDADLGAASEGEPAMAAYCENGGAPGEPYAVHAVPHTTPLVAGPRCLPGNFEFETPYNSSVFPTLVQATMCNSLSSDTKATLERFDHFGVSVSWEMQYTPRVFILAQNPTQDTTRMFDKRDVVLCVDGAASITGINTHAWVKKGEFTLENVKGKSLYAISAARHIDYDCGNNPFFSIEDSLLYGTYVGLFCIQKAESPAGTLKILNDDNLVNRVWTLTESFFKFTENYLNCGFAERFIPTFNNSFFTEVDTANSAYKDASITDEVARSYYSFTFPNIIHAGVTHRCPMSETIDEFLGLPVTGMFTEPGGTDSHRPNATCAKNIASSIVYEGQRLDIYFSTFLEATYVYANSKWAPTENQQVFMGAAKKQSSVDVFEYDVLRNLKEAFTQFRINDLAEGRVQPLDPHPCAGAAMLYPFKKGVNFFSDELDCFNKINEYRLFKEVPKLKWDGTLTTAAATHAQDLIDTMASGHQGSDNSQSWHRIMACGVTGWCKRTSAYGEIIALNCDTAAEAVALWKASVAGHHEALYSKRHIACGLAVRASEATGKIWVVTFAGDYTLDTIP